MHELSIAMSVVDLAAEEGERLGGKVSAVHLRVGVLSGVVREALEGSYEMAAHGTPLQGSKLVIEEVPLVVYCTSCEGERSPDPGQWLSCPDCGTPTPEIRRGKELELVALEIEDAGTPHR